VIGTCRRCGADTPSVLQLCGACRSANDPQPFVHETQLVLPGLGPNVGERWRNRNTGKIAAVVAVNQRRYGWVDVRINDGIQTLTAAGFQQHFTRV
jgi:hypothetical protein